VVAAGHSVDLVRWREAFDVLMSRVAGRFTRVEPRRRAGLFVQALLSDLPRKNCWTIAEHAGDGSPDGMQHLLRRAVWDADAVRDDVRAIAVEHLGSQDAMLVVDETGDVKKGAHTVGVQRQYTGTAGRIENAQVGVFLTYTTKVGHTLIDRELYLPACWTDDPDRLAEAGVPADTEFATKTELARQMIIRVLDSGVSVPWVAGDEVYGAAGALRAELEGRGVGYVLAVACDHHVPTATGSRRADHLVARLPKRAWQRLSAGRGAKGHRFYDWAWITITATESDAAAGYRWLLARRNRRTGELAYYRCFSPDRVPLGTLVRVAGRRWTIEESFQTSKGADRTGRAPGPHLDLLVPLDHSGAAGTPLSRRHHRRRTCQTHPGRADSLIPQRDPAPIHPAGHPPRPRHHRLPALVLVATTPPIPRPTNPLPATIQSRTMKITIYGWSTRRRKP
jgi:SRSO17 transposase